MAFLYVYLTIGLVYALWIWLFKGATIFSIPFNAVLGPFYILGVFWHFLTWRKTTIHSVFAGKKAVIFDLDGTILDNQDAWNDAIENIKKKVGLELERNYPSGLNVVEKWRSLLRDSDKTIPFTAEQLGQMTNEEFLRIYTDVEAREGFWSLMRYLREKGFKIALASNSNRALVDELLARIDATDIFDFVLAGDEVSKQKPDPEIYNKTLETLGVRAGEAVAFEDSLTGAESAIAAKIATIIIWDEEISKVLYPRNSLFFLDNFEGLEDSIERSPREQAIEALEAVQKEEQSQ